MIATGMTDDPSAARWMVETIMADVRNAGWGEVLRVPVPGEGASLSRKPLAPARSASYTYWSKSNVVRMRIRAVSSAARIRRVAWSPSSWGMRMSIKMTVGWKRAAASTASSPLLASATTSIVAYLGPQAVGSVADGHVGVAGAGVLEHVGQAFLNDSIGGQVEGRGERERLALDMQPDRQARPP